MVERPVLQDISSHGLGQIEYVIELLLTEHVDGKYMQSSQAMRVWEVWRHGAIPSQAYVGHGGQRSQQLPCLRWPLSREARFEIAV